MIALNSQFSTFVRNKFWIYISTSEFGLAWCAFGFAHTKKSGKKKLNENWPRVLCTAPRTHSLVCKHESTVIEVAVRLFGLLKQKSACRKNVSIDICLHVHVFPCDARDVAPIFQIYIIFFFPFSSYTTIWTLKVGIDPIGRLLRVYFSEAGNYQYTTRFFSSTLVLYTFFPTIHGKSNIKPN